MFWTGLSSIVVFAGAIEELVAEELLLVVVDDTETVPVEARLREEVVEDSDAELVAVVLLDELEEELSCACAL